MAWKKITEERYDEMLGVVPPAVQYLNGFLVGEPVSLRDGRQTYRAFRETGGEFFENEEPMTIAEFNKFYMDSNI